jgi:hypothetical protein
VLQAADPTCARGFLSPCGSRVSRRRRRLMDAALSKHASERVSTKASHVGKHASRQPFSAHRKHSVALPPPPPTFALHLYRRASPAPPRTPWDLPSPPDSHAKIAPRASSPLPADSTPPGTPRTPRRNCKSLQLPLPIPLLARPSPVRLLAAGPQLYAVETASQGVRQSTTNRNRPIAKSKEHEAHREHSRCKAQSVAPFDEPACPAGAPDDGTGPPSAVSCAYTSCASSSSSLRSIAPDTA